MYPLLFGRGRQMQGSESTVTHAVAIQSEGRDTPAAPRQRGRLTYLTQCRASESGMFTPFASTSCDVRHRNPVTVIGRISRINMSQERASMRARALVSPARGKTLRGQSGRAEARAWRHVVAPRTAARSAALSARQLSVSRRARASSQTVHFLCNSILHSAGRSHASHHIQRALSHVAP